MRLVALAAFALSATQAAADPVVVELFTSQGCSSCPPADAMLGQLTERRDVLPLSLHVDYWDWIGWPDTFAVPAHAERQRGYAAGVGSSVLYTPQFVVGGSGIVAGAKGMALADTVQAHLAAPREVLEIEGDTLVMQAAGQPAELVMVEVEPLRRVAVPRGENAGRELVYHNIVRAWTPMGSWDGAAGRRALPPASEPDRMRVVLAQRMGADGRPGAILGAAADR
ncbi:thioredoxin family protein [Jannaschia sp. W003]|uniref:DUF1223 domain-containing protein n=1 Tax=Jannaschia sp. W003 TaxID=2867012 RepID=UPI0021A31FA3|nr:DUF1223 domain-containing protein [Jannaschia sp. W003]UWQ21042.1 DUF1223 domain-containing protein [Jannaschia sp. W003]